jgi:hypothetical protein
MRIRRAGGVCASAVEIIGEFAIAKNAAAKSRASHGAKEPENTRCEFVAAGSCVTVETAGRTVVVTVIVVLVPGTTDVGLNVAAAPTGRPLAVKAIVAEFPPIEDVAIRKTAVWPATTVCPPLELDRLKLEIVTATAPVEDARSVALPANNAATVLGLEF